MPHQIHRCPALGTCVMINAGWYKSLPRKSRTFSDTCILFGLGKKFVIKDNGGAHDLSPSIKNSIT
jgi:hypothetical protein